LNCTLTKLVNGSKSFKKKSSKHKDEQVDLDKLYAKISKLEVERYYLKNWIYWDEKGIDHQPKQ
jgi:hypothetical protein